MPTFTPERLTQISYDLLRAVGSRESHARTVAEHLTNANLAGHDSHGFIRIIQYVREINEGRHQPDCRTVSRQRVPDDSAAGRQLDVRAGGHDGCP